MLDSAWYLFVMATAYPLLWLLADNVRCAIADIVMMFGAVLFFARALWRAD